MSMFFALRDMAENVQSFHTGGTLWFPDLSASAASSFTPSFFPDWLALPTGLPIMCGVTMLAVIEVMLKVGCASPSN